MIGTVLDQRLFICLISILTTASRFFFFFKGLGQQSSWKCVASLVGSYRWALCLVGMLLLQFNKAEYFLEMS